MPAADATLLFKHVSMRPPGLDQAAYVLRGVLKPHMLASPLDYLEIAEDREEISGGYDPSARPMEGSFKLLEEDPEPSNYPVRLVYLDHPLLRFVDVFRPSLRPSTVQGLFDLRMTIESDFSTVCSKDLSAPPSPRLMIIALLAAQTIKYLACPTGADPRRFSDLLTECGGAETLAFRYDQHLLFGANNAQTFVALAKDAKDLDLRYCSMHRNAWTYDQVSAIRPTAFRGFTERLRPKGDGWTITKLGHFVKQTLVEAQRSGGRANCIVRGFDLISALETIGNKSASWGLHTKKYESMLASSNALKNSDEAVFDDQETRRLDRSFAGTANALWQQVLENELLGKPAKQST
jgi:hypothetical protein